MFWHPPHVGGNWRGQWSWAVCWEEPPSLSMSPRGKIWSLRGETERPLFGRSPGVMAWWAVALLGLLCGNAQTSPASCGQILQEWPTAKGKRSWEELAEVKIRGEAEPDDPVGQADCILLDILSGDPLRSFQERLRTGIRRLEGLLQNNWQDSDNASLKAAMAVRRNLAWAESMVDGHAENWKNLDRAFGHYSTILNLHTRAVEAGFNTQDTEAQPPPPVTIFDLSFSGRICRDPMTLPPTEIVCGDKEAPAVEHEPLAVERARRSLDSHTSLSSLSTQWAQGPHGLSLRHLYIDHMKRSLTDFIYGGRFLDRRKALSLHDGTIEPAMEPDWADLASQVQGGDCQKHAGTGACDHPWQVRELV